MASIHTFWFYFHVTCFIWGRRFKSCDVACPTFKSSKINLYIRRRVPCVINDTFFLWKQFKLHSLPTGNQYTATFQTSAVFTESADIVRFARTWNAYKNKGRGCIHFLCLPRNYSWNQILLWIIPRRLYLFIFRRGLSFIRFLIIV